jgi:hypothetical protein
MPALVPVQTLDSSHASGLGLVWFVLVLFVHPVSYVTLDTSITDYNLQHTYNIWASTQYNIKYNNTKFKDQLEVEFATTSRYTVYHILINAFKGTLNSNPIHTGQQSKIKTP